MTSQPLRVTRSAVRRGNRIVACLLWSGRQATVVMQADRRKIAGRVFPAGYMAGQPSDEIFEAWTAKHPAVPTPSDRCLAGGLSFSAAVTLLVEAQMANETQVERFFQGEQRRGEWVLHGQGGAGPVAVRSLIGRTVNISTSSGMVYDSAAVIGLDQDGVLILRGGMHQSYADPRPLPTRMAEVRVRDITRGYVHPAAEDSVA